MTTQAEAWHRQHHGEMPSMTICEDRGFQEGYNDDNELVVVFPDGSYLTENGETGLFTEI
jgi:hypothetical protein